MRLISNEDLVNQELVSSEEEDNNDGVDEQNEKFENGTVDRILRNIEEGRGEILEDSAVGKMHQNIIVRNPVEMIVKVDHDPEKLREAKA